MGICSRERKTRIYTPVFIATFLVAENREENVHLLVDHTGVVGPYCQPYTMNLWSCRSREDSHMHSAERKIRYGKLTYAGRGEVWRESRSVGLVLSKLPLQF